MTIDVRSHLRWIVADALPVIVGWELGKRILIDISWQ